MKKDICTHDIIAAMIFWTYAYLPYHVHIRRTLLRMLRRNNISVGKKDWRIMKNDCLVDTGYAEWVGYVLADSAKTIEDPYKMAADFARWHELQLGCAWLQCDGTDYGMTQSLVNAWLDYQIDNDNDHVIFRTVFK